MCLTKYLLLFLLNFIFSNSKVSPLNSSTSVAECSCEMHVTLRSTVCQDSNYCVLYEVCVNGKWCMSPNIITHGSASLREIDLVIFRGSTFIPRCFIINLPELRIIQARNQKITVVEPLAFRNLPKLEEIDLSFNYLTEIHYGIFSGLPIFVLDLSWNQISYIGEGTFHGMTNLKKLNLSRNSLAVFHGSFYFFLKYVKQFASLPLETLILSYNFLSLVIYLKYFPRLRNIDLSHNRMSFLDIHSLDPSTKIDTLDLADNFIASLKLNKSNLQIRKLRICFNNLQGPADLFIEGSKVKIVAIDGNPWICKYYDRLLLYLHKENITVLRHNEDAGVYFLTAVERENYPTCYLPAQIKTNRLFHNSGEVYTYYSDMKDRYKVKKHATCRNDQDCPDNMVCKNNQCWDPCKYNVCHKTSECLTGDHTFVCTCPMGKLRKPNTIDSRCYHVECFVDEDCEIGSKCNTLEHICDPDESLMSER